MTPWHRENVAFLNIHKHPHKYVFGFDVSGDFVQASSTELPTMWFVKFVTMKMPQKNWMEGLHPESMELVLRDHLSELLRRDLDILLFLGAWTPLDVTFGITTRGCATDLAWRLRTRAASGLATHVGNHLQSLTENFGKDWKRWVQFVHFVFSLQSPINNPPSPPAEVCLRDGSHCKHGRNLEEDCSCCSSRILQSTNLRNASPNCLSNTTKYKQEIDM